MSNRRRRALLASVVVVAVLAGGCTGGDDDASPTSTTKAPEKRPEPPPGEPIPVDDDVLTGTLDNGITYYVRENDDPGGRAQLRLVVHAGSANETDDQSGAAHFLEHMLFNGTEEYPANELSEVLADFGGQFGPDINAYTSYDETVYMLEVETDEGNDNLEVGVDVLAQWASAATIDPDEVDAERGVVLEERRLAVEDAAGRMETAYGEAQMAGTPYEGHDTIGTEKSIEEIPADELRAFYETWYRPENIAVVAAGDFDDGDVVDFIEEAFEDSFADADQDDAERADPASTDLPATYAAFEDAELDRTSVRLFVRTDSLDLDTVEGQQVAMLQEVVTRLIGQRLENDTLRGTVPLLSAETEALTGQLNLMDGIEMSLEANDTEVGAALTTGLEELERARQHGFTDDELELVQEQIVNELDIAYEEMAQQDDFWAEMYVDAFLGYGPAASTEDAHDLAEEAVEAITIDDVEGWVADLPEPSVFAAAPSLDALGADPEAAIEELAGDIAGSELDERPAEPPIPDDLMDRPDGQPYASKDELDFSTEYVLANGTKVILVSDPELDYIYVDAWSPGGWSLLGDEDVVAAQLMPGIAAQSGLGELDRVQVDGFLAGTSVEAEPYISEFDEGVQGGALPDEVEELFQLVHLYLSDIRPTPAAAELELDETRTQAAHPERDAELASSLALFDAYYSGSARHRQLPTLEQLDAFELARGEEIYRQRFADAADLTIVVVGTFDEGEVEELIGPYFGSLPAAGATESWVDTAPPFPTGLVTRRVEAGTGGQASVQMVFEAPVAVTGEQVVVGNVLQTVVEDRLLEEIREELGAAYSPQVSVNISDQPRPTITTYVRVDTDPDEVETVSAAVRAVLADLAADGPTDDELGQAQQQLRRDYELSNGPQRAEAAILGITNPDQGLAWFFFERTEQLEDVTVAQVQQLAALAFPADNSIEVTQVPAP